MNRNSDEFAQEFCNTVQIERFVWFFLLLSSIFYLLSAIDTRNLVNQSSSQLSMKRLSRANDYKILISEFSHIYRYSNLSISSSRQLSMKRINSASDYQISSIRARERTLVAGQYTGLYIPKTTPISAVGCLAQMLCVTCNYFSPQCNILCVFVFALFY